jgi:hypothetical protein
LHKEKSLFDGEKVAQLSAILKQQQATLWQKYSNLKFHPTSQIIECHHWNAEIGIYA